MKQHIENEASAENQNAVKACIDSCRKWLERMENAKTEIVEEFREKLGGHQHLVELAVNEAEALAWQTDFPHLLFPALAMEKATSVANWRTRQNQIRRATASFAFAA